MEARSQLRHRPTCKIFNLNDFRLPATLSQTAGAESASILLNAGKLVSCGDSSKLMKRKLTLRWLCALAFLLATAAAQAPPAPQANAATPPVPYSSVSQLNLLLSQLDQAAQATHTDLSKLKIDKWKADPNSKQQTLGNVASLQRNLQGALPEIIAELKTSPENLTSTFKLYRNLDAVYDVFSSVVEATGAFGSKEDFQALGNDLTALERSRRSFADRVETLAGAKEVELTKLRSALQAAQAAATPPAPPKKVIVDDTEPVKKPVKKKTTTAAKPTTTTTPPATTPQTTPPKPQ